MVVQTKWNQKWVAKNRERVRVYQQQYRLKNKERYNKLRSMRRKRDREMLGKSRVRYFYGDRPLRGKHEYCGLLILGAFYFGLLLGRFAPRKGRV